MFVVVSKVSDERERENQLSHKTQRTWGNGWVRMDERKRINSLESMIMEIKTDQEPTRSQLSGAVDLLDLKEHLGTAISKNQELGALVIKALGSG